MYKKMDLSRFEMILTQKSSISTWIFSNLHVGKKHSPRGDEMKLRKNQTILRKNQMKLPKYFFFSTWRIKNSHVRIRNFSRGYLWRLSLLVTLFWCLRHDLDYRR